MRKKNDKETKRKRERERKRKTERKRERERTRERERDSECKSRAQGISRQKESGTEAPCALLTVWCATTSNNLSRFFKSSESMNTLTRADEQLILEALFFIDTAPTGGSKNTFEHGWIWESLSVADSTCDL